MYLMLIGIAITIFVLSFWYIVKENNYNKYGYALSVATVVIFFGVISFIGNAIAEGEPEGAFKAGSAFMFLVVILSIVSYRLLKKNDEKKSVKDKEEESEQTV